MGEIPTAAVHRIIKKAGAERASEDAAKELSKALEEVGIKIAKEALDHTAQAKRKTVKAEDIRMAVKRLAKS